MVGPKPSIVSRRQIIGMNHVGLLCRERWASNVSNPIVISNMYENTTKPMMSRKRTVNDNVVKGLHEKVGRHCALNGSESYCNMLPHIQQHELERRLDSQWFKR